MIKTIVLHLAADAHLAARRQAALALAAKHGAAIMGVAPLAAPMAAAYVEAPVSAELIEAQIREARTQAETLGRELQAMTERAALTAAWFAEEGDPADVLARHAASADLLVLSQEESGEALGVADDLALRSAAPVLFIPYAGAHYEIGSRVLVGWNGAREGARAMRDALPFLTRAEQVTLVAADLAPERRPELDRALAFLTRHGVAAQARSLPETDVDAGDVLLSAIADEDADLLVMGAYGHSRLRELVLGGATRHVLRHMTAPVLMSH